MTTILLVEQDPHQRILYRYELQDAGYEVILACCGADALGIIRQYHPHLVLVNPSLPDMQFHVFVRLLRSEQETVPLIAHSSDLQKEEVVRKLVDAFVLKGSDLSPLCDQIADLLRADDVSTVT